MFGRGEEGKSVCAAKAAAAEASKRPGRQRWCGGSAAFALSRPCVPASSLTTFGATHPKHHLDYYCLYPFSHSSRASYIQGFTFYLLVPPPPEAVLRRYVFGAQEARWAAWADATGSQLALAEKTPLIGPLLGPFTPTCFSCPSYCCTAFSRKLSLSGPLQVTHAKRRFLAISGHGQWSHTTAVRVCLFFQPRARMLVRVNAAIGCLGSLTWREKL